jgi:AcrR family transcriptional regulator
VKDEIIHRATELFLNYGFKSVTMDDIAHELGISKKTIYSHFKNKGELVDATTMSLFEVISKEINLICDLEKNPIEEIYDIKQTVMGHLKNEKASPQYQLQKYYPKTFNSLKQKQYDMMLTCVNHNLNRGKELGIYRENIDVPFISKLYFYTLLNIRDIEYFPLTEYSLADILEQFYEYHLRGICTLKGLSILDNFIKQTISQTND